MSQNYEKLYNDLKIENDQIKKDNDDICKEYELTIQMLTDSVNKIQKEKESLESKIAQLENDQKKYEKEKESLQEKNKDKMIDIQNLTKNVEKLKQDLKLVSGDKKLDTTKIVTLEKDNDHYQNKIRQNEAVIEDINNQLESALEENITLQTEFELYKQNAEVSLVRKDEEIKDLKNDLANKEKIIERLNEKRVIKELQQIMKLDPSSINHLTKHLSSSIVKPVEEKEKINFNRATTIGEKKLITPVCCSTTKLPTKFEEIYRKSLCMKNELLNNVTQKSKEITNSVTKNEENKNKNNNMFNAISSKTVNSIKGSNIFNNNNDTIKERENENIENLNENDLKKSEEEYEKDVIEDNDETSLYSDKRTFEDLVICDEKDFNIIPIKKLLSNNKQMKNGNNMASKDKKLKDNLEKMLLLVQQKKKNLKLHQKSFKNKVEKMGYSLRNK